MHSIRLTLTPLEDRLAPADLRIVTYNITAADGNVRPGIVGTAANPGILDSIGLQTVGGVTRPADVILLQEVDTGLTAVQDVVTLLNTRYGSGAYAASTKAGVSTGGGTQGLVYRTSTVDLLETVAVGTASGSGAPRQPLRYKLRPDGTTTDLYLYNSHMKSETAVTDISRRLIEAEEIRGNADALPAGANIFYAGDFNFYDSDTDEPAYGTFLAAGNGQAEDVANPTNNWKRNSSGFVSLYSQAPLNNPPSGLVGGGLDDRFDYILMSSELTDAAGLEYRSGSYRVFGNNGSLAVNSDITSAANTALGNTSLTAPQRTAVLGYLGSASDHLPVVADLTYPTSPPPPPAPTAVSSYAIPGGVQRSRVTSVTVTFNAIVSSTLTVSNFTLTGFPGVLSVSHTVGSATAVLNFADAGTQFTSLSDGEYQLSVNVADVTVNTGFAFHRLFGDGNGDGTVDAVDFAGLGAVFGQTVIASPYDFDGNNTVDAADLSQFGVRFGRTV